MGRTYNADWVIPVLKDVENFLLANNMVESSHLVAEVVARVQVESIALWKKPARGTDFSLVDGRGQVLCFRGLVKER